MNPDAITAHLPLVASAAELLDRKAVLPYCELRRLLANATAVNCEKFEWEFAKYYGLNSAGLSPEFKQRYFELLFGVNRSVMDNPQYGPLLSELYNIPRIQGDLVLQCSFVSKMVAIHDESRPLYDKYVGAFFGLTVPQTGPTEFRITGFVANLEIIRGYYFAWINDPRFQSVFERVLNRIPELRSCNLIRVCDFLVWQTGKEATFRRKAPAKVNERVLRARSKFRDV